MFKRGLVITLLALGLIFISGEKSMSIAGNYEPDIKDIVVCNIYWENFRYVNLDSPRLSKVVVTFNSNRPVDPDAIDYITVEGPDGYSFGVNIEPYTYENLNGYIYSGAYIWFMGFDREGFMEDGSYIVTLKYKSGKVSQKSRVLKYSDDILKAYLATQVKFSPKGRLPSSTELNNVILKWTLLDEVDAFYMTRLGQWQSGRGRTGGWFFQDNIFGGGTGDPRNTGLNKGEVRVRRKLAPNTRYYWFTEILDSNDFNKINIAIFQAYQNFKTPR